VKEKLSLLVGRQSILATLFIFGMSMTSSVS